MQEKVFLIHVSVQSTDSKTYSMTKGMVEDNSSKMHVGQEVERGEGRAQQRVNPSRSVCQSPATSNQAPPANSKSAPMPLRLSTSKYST